MPWQKGQSGNPAGGSAAQRADRMVVFDLKQAARRLCPEALATIERAMHSKDERVRVMAATVILERGYGKPEQKADLEVVHRFAEVPQVMDQETWLARRGQPLLEAKAVRETCPDAPTTLDRTPSDEPDPTKLN
jgi:hypothetical protein